jgi:hypothetical protein
MLTLQVRGKRRRRLETAHATMEKIERHGAATTERKVSPNNERMLEKRS